MSLSALEQIVVQGSAWLIAFGLFAAVVLGALVVQWILIRVGRRISHRWHPIPRSLFERSRNIARFAFVILATAFAVPITPLTPKASAIVHHLLVASFVILAGWITIIAMHVAIDHYVGRWQLNVADNLAARKAVTQVRILRRTGDILIGALTMALALMTFDSVREYGVSLFASAGIVGVIMGLAAQPTLGNLFAGLQLAITQPIRIDDAVIVENEWGRIEEITATYVVVKIWDLRRLVVPLSYFLQKPFQNWTRRTATLIGSVYLYVDYTVPVDAVRTKLSEIVRESKLWDGDVVNLQVTDCKEWTVEMRALMSAGDSGAAWDLRCLVREKLIAFLQQEYPEALARVRTDMAVRDTRHTTTGPGDAVRGPGAGGGKAKPV